MREPVVELRETALFKRLIKEDPEFALRTEKLVVGLSPLLASTVRHFPFYTRHDAHHGYNVVRRIKQVVKPDCFVQKEPESFSASELFLLIAASYAHDLGMTVFPGEEDGLLKTLGISKTSGWETHQSLQDYLRAEHSKRGGQYIDENAEELGIPRPLVGALDKMMRAHNLSIADLEKHLSSPYACQAQEIDVRQLAAIVCVADALEFSDTRVIDGVIDAINLDPSPAAKTSYQENMKHICVGDSLAVRPDGSVLVSGAFSEEDVLALAHRTMDEIEGWVRGYCDVDRRSKQPRLLIRPETFQRNMDFSGGRFERIGVRLNKKNVIDLIASNAVWRDNKGIAIRELIQNAIEACRYREHNSSNADAYVPAVTVTFSRVDRSVVVSDNGCGMSERTALNNFLTVGSSRSREPGYSEANYAPIARFGIGFWSVFTIAEDAYVETAEYEPFRGSAQKSAAADGFGFGVSLHELKEYTVFRPVVRPCGTAVKLKLRPDVVIDDVYSAGLATIFCSEIPLTFVLDGIETTVPEHLPDVSVKDVMGERKQVMSEHGIKLFHWRHDADGIEVAIGLAYRTANGKATFLLSPGQSIMSEIGFYRRQKTSVCGFAASLPVKEVCIDLNRVGTFSANLRSPAGIEFSLDRQGIRPNRIASESAEKIRDLIHEGYRAFLKHTKSKDPATIVSLREQAAMHGGNIFDTFTETEFLDAASRYPDLLALRLYPVIADKNFEKSTPICVDLNELRRVSGTVFFVQRQFLSDKANKNKHLPLENLEVLKATHGLISSWVAAGKIATPAYVMAPDRAGSMLFDADPESSVLFEAVGPLTLCVQFADLERLRFDAPPTNILAKVQGRWSGAVYERQFITPDGKPYLFLGRHRLLVNKSSVLANHVAKLATDKRFNAIADLAADLLEDEQGYAVDKISHLL